LFPEFAVKESTLKVVDPYYTKNKEEDHRYDDHIDNARDGHE